MVAHPDRSEQIDLEALRISPNLAGDDEVLALVEAVAECLRHADCPLCGVSRDTDLGHEWCPLARFVFAVPAETKEPT